MMAARSCGRRATGPAPTGLAHRRCAGTWAAVLGYPEAAAAGAGSGAPGSAAAAGGEAYRFAAGQAQLVEAGAAAAGATAAGSSSAGAPKRSKGTLLIFLANYSIILFLLVTYRTLLISISRIACFLPGTS